jgi:hypothetical protein
MENLMKPILKLSMLAVASALATVSVAPDASARNTAAFIGRARDAAEASCFNESYGSLINDGFVGGQRCGNSVIILPLVMDPGPFNNWARVTVTAKKPTWTTTMSCATFVFDKATGGGWSGGGVDLATTGWLENIKLPDTPYYPDTSPFAACTVGPGAQVVQLVY